MSTATSPDDDLVAVVVPAYHAERWIDETLRSVRAQTHHNLEIIVVDDGSRDATFEVASRHAAVDPRVRVVRQANGGVAAARNRGIAETRGAFIAPVDADDLWAPDKIERQLEAMRRGGERVGLVYSWFANIDADSHVQSHHDRARVEGDALAAMCISNLVGNGSSALMRRAAVIEAGGYDSGLRAANAQGCEDYKLYFRIAERHSFALVPDYLTGYRELPGNMSSDLWQMLRSRDHCIAEFAPKHPKHAELFRKGRSRLLRFMLSRSVRTGRLRDACALLAEMLRHAPRYAAADLARIALNVTGSRARGLLRRGRDREARVRFAIGEL